VRKQAIFTSLLLFKLQILLKLKLLVHLRHHILKLLAFFLLAFQMWAHSFEPHFDQVGGHCHAHEHQGLVDYILVNWEVSLLEVSLHECEGIDSFSHYLKREQLLKRKHDHHLDQLDVRHSLPVVQVLHRE